MQKPTFNKRAGGMSYWLARGEPGCGMALREAEQTVFLRSGTVSKNAADATRQRAGRQKKAPDSATEAPGRSDRIARAARAHSAEGAGPEEQLKTLEKFEQRSGVTLRTTERQAASAGANGTRQQAG